MIKDEHEADTVQNVCTQGLNLLRVLMIYLTPVVPELAADARMLFKETEWDWQAAQQPLLGRQISKFKPLITRVEQAQVDKMIEQSKQT